MRFDYANFYRRSHYAVIRVYDERGNVIEMHEHKGAVQRVVLLASHRASRKKISHDSTLVGLLPSKRGD